MASQSTLMVNQDLPGPADSTNQANYRLDQSAPMPPDRLLKRAEVEVYFGLSRRFLEVSAVSGDGPPMIKIRRSVKYRVGDLREWIEAHRVNSTSDEVKS